MNPDPITTMAAEIKRLKQEIDRWRNVAGIMHEFIQEGDCKGAKQHYEQECAPWM